MPETNNEKPAQKPVKKAVKTVSSAKKGSFGVTAKTVVTRGRIALIIILIAMIALVGRFVYLQIIDPSDYKVAALEQYTSSVTIPAKRGSIYASDGKTELAVSVTVYNCFISPYDMTEEQDFEPQNVKKLAEGLAQILNVDANEILEKASRTNSKYQMIKKSLTDAEELAVREFIKENKFTSQIHLEESTKRSYRYGSLAAQTIGFTGAENNGLAGIELAYNQYLSGVAGKSVKAADAYGNELDSGVGSTFIPPQNGYNVVSTIDWQVQNTVEKYIKLAYEEHKPNGGVKCMIMDVSNGEILASGIYPSFDLNSYAELNDYYQALYDEYPTKFEEEKLRAPTDEERSAYRTELMNKMWQNTLVSWTYEPGSTFKIITSCMAIEEGTVSLESSSFSCNGSYTVGGVVIHCHKKRPGHGTQSFSEALVNSCNPAFIQIGASVGASRFKRYFEEFGYTNSCGIDLPGEAGTIYYDTYKTQFESVELAVYSFGQTFKTTPVQHLRAVSAIANGGYLVVPHYVKALTDDYGNVVKTFEYETDRQVISKSTADTLLKILTNSTKNACVSGYNVVSKTGTSEKRDTARTDDYISSCVTFAPAEDPKIAIIVLVDEPTMGQHFGSAVAAPIVSNILSEVLPHLGISPNTSDDDIVTVGDYRNEKVSNARSVIEETLGLKCVVRGSGDTVIDQMPHMETSVYKDGVVILYTEPGEIAANVKVPNLKNNSPEAAIRSLVNNNLNVSLSGIFNGDYKNCRVVSQTPEAGEYVLPGTVVTLEFLYEESIE